MSTKNNALANEQGSHNFKYVAAAEICIKMVIQLSSVHELYFKKIFENSLKTNGLRTL